MDNIKIGVMGVGFVGETLVKVLSEFYEIIPYDKYKEPYTNPERLSEANVIFISVPTPMKETGEIDLSSIYDALDLLSGMEFSEKPLVVIRSSVVPGTTDELAERYDFGFAFNPEFLREKTALQDFIESNKVVIGGDDKSFEILESIYRKFLPNARYIKVDRKTAEMIKYASNVTLACQITVANEIHKICETLGIDYNDVKDAILLDERIGRNIDVPGKDGNFGFGGKCFPKDINALIYLAKQKGYNPELLEEVWKSNLKFRENHDWHDIPGATSKNNFGGKI